MWWASLMRLLPTGGHGYANSGGGWMLCLSGVVWPTPNSKFPVIWMRKSGTYLHLYGGTCSPLSHAQLWHPANSGGNKQPFVTFPCDWGSWPAISPLQDGKDLPCKACIKARRKDCPLMALWECLLFVVSATVRDLDCAAFDMRAKVMILECNVLSPIGVNLWEVAIVIHNLLSSGTLQTKVVVFMWTGKMLLISLRRVINRMKSWRARESVMYFASAVVNAIFVWRWLTQKTGLHALWHNLFMREHFGHFQRLLVTSCWQSWRWLSTWSLLFCQAFRWYQACMCQVDSIQFS